MPVPSTSESGRFRLGFFTSPAVKVTLFQASAEKSDPTWASAITVIVPTRTPADIMKCVQPCVIPEVPVKIGGECQGIAPTEQSEQCQSQQRSDFRRSKNVLD